MRTSATPLMIRGFTLVELMVATALLIVVMSGVAGLYLANRNARVAEDLSQNVEAQLRLGMDKLLFKLRNAGYGVPTSPPPLSSWVTWVSGYSETPKTTAGASASDPDTLSVLSCTSKPIAFVASDAPATQTYLDLDSAVNLNATNRSVIMINDSVSAKILSVSGNRINIDRVADDATYPSTLGVQNLGTNVKTGTPICRVDVVTYTVDTATATLREDLNQGAGPQVIMDGIINMKITSQDAGAAWKYQVTLTARASDTDPLSNTIPQRSLTSLATFRK